MINLNKTNINYNTVEFFISDLLSGCEEMVDCNECIIYDECKNITDTTFLERIAAVYNKLKGFNRI